MRILVHEFSGFAFPLGLSRELAKRGHTVLHVYCASFPNAKGAVDRSDDDPKDFFIQGLEIQEQFERYSAGGYSFLKRIKHEVRYARKFVSCAAKFRPEVVLSGDTPLIAQWGLVRWANSSRTPFVFWQQDIYSLPMKAEARRRLGPLGILIGEGFVRLERSLLRRSQAVIPISEDFEPFLAEGGVEPSKIRTVHNWAPIEQLPVRPKVNPWSCSIGLEDKRVLMYTGTLGLKHNPQLLWALAQRVRELDDVRFVIASEGGGIDWLKAQLESKPNPNLLLLPFQPFDSYADVLGTADVLLAILEPDSGVYAVPSKVLSYHCAGRPIVASLPSQNLAAKIIARSGSGVLALPGDETSFVGTAVELLGDAERRTELGKRARKYAEQHFEIGAVTNEFEELFISIADRMEPDPPTQATTRSQGSQT